MPGRTISPIATEAIHKTETEEVFLVLLELDHDDFNNPLRLVNNDVDIISNGNLFTAFPFEITLPNDEENIIPQAKLKIDNTDRQIVQAIRSIGSDPIDVLLQVVLAPGVSYSGNFFSVADEQTAPRGMAFNDDGLKMFVVGDNPDHIHEYNLTRPYNLAVGVKYSGNFFSVFSQDDSPQGIVFNDDGTKIFVVGDSSNAIYEYDLTIPYSLAAGNVTYSNDSFSVNSEDSSPRGMASSAVP